MHRFYPQLIQILLYLVLPAQYTTHPFILFDHSSLSYLLLVNTQNTKTRGFVVFERVLIVSSSIIIGFHRLSNQKKVVSISMNT
jgi:hypothetical protein